ncbi:hypothetical protein [Mesorhizobium sp. B2-5-11]|uniref:hypothetical protein n=1 Tax=Mesorhizobium sp. B2-5-11 TaxID=2589919 RepID=UPI00112DDFBD|nr:hypothetical protein [Mesorhizobium sp. B2-5-11]TPK14132.1 hypothetical protein FJ490_02075 [Mesorhizobium sp. B2-5-11]
MDKRLKALCSKHRLTSVSVALYLEAKVTPFTVYLHWNDHEDSDARDCVGGNGNTVNDALASALGQMSERRPARIEAENKETAA